MINSITKSKLQELKQLFDSNLISELEYNTLKEEILFDKKPNSPHNNEKINQISINKENDINSNSYDENYKNKEDTSINLKTQNEDTSKYFYFAFFIIFAIIMMNIFSNDNSNQDNNLNSSIDTTSTSTTSNDVSSLETICKICGRNFTGYGYDRIDGIWQKNTSMQTELCSPTCAKNESEKMGNVYDEILEKHGYQKIFTKCSRCTGHYEDGFCNICGAASAEKVNEAYSKMPNCEMCNGSGITNGYSGNRICSVCNGTGKQTF
jgi:hypothetical protein